MAAGRQQMMLDELVQRALAYRTGPELKELFEFTRRFPHLAPYNAMLLHVQNPGIRYALRAKAWEEEFGRCVRPAARPYVILQPFGPVAFVFDLSDTAPIDPAKDKVPKGAANPFPTKGKPPFGALAKLTDACKKIAIEVEERDYGTSLAGRVQLGPRPWFVHISLNIKHTDAQKLGTLAHELAHVFCGHLGATHQRLWPDRLGLPHETRELEAEAVAYLVTERLHLDIGSIQYLAGYLKQDQLPDYSLDAVLTATNIIEQMIQGQFRPRKRP